MNKAYIIIGALLTVIIVFVTCDYFTLFGTKLVEKLDFIEMNFKTFDEVSGASVLDVKVRCFQRNNNNACAQRDSGRAGIVSINIPVQKIVTQSILFDQDVKVRETSDPKLHIMFIHPDYARPVETIYVEEFQELSERVMRVSMPKSMRNP
jgi:hypothetical protein